MSIPAKKLVNVIPGVLSPGGNPLALNTVMLTTSTRVPTGAVLAFPAAGDAVGNFFGPTSIEATLAAIYSSGFTNCDSLPETIYFAQYNQVAVAAYLRSGSFQGVTLAQLQQLSGVLTVPINGRSITSANIDLATAASFSNAAQLIQTGLQVAGGAFTGQATIDNGAGVAGNTLTITAVTTGAVQIGDVVAGAGIAPGTTITAFVSGAGGLGTYTVNGAAQLITPAVAVTVASVATVTYDAQLFRFLINSPTTGAASTIGFATGSLSTGLKFTQSTGAVLSQGAAAATPAAFMPSVAAATQNWATFMTVFEPDTDTKLEFATWVQTTQDRYAYVAWDSDSTVLDGVAPTSFGAQVEAANMDGVFPIYEPATDDGNGRKAAFVCSCVGSIDFDQPGGRITFANKSQAGLVADVTDESSYDNALANGYNVYADFATSKDQFVNLQPGSTPGAWNWFDAYINQIWLNSEFQLALMVFMVQAKSNPYNSEGYNNIRAVLGDPIQRALTSGVIQAGVTLSSSQRVQINTAGGPGAADAVQNNGYFLMILDAPPAVRAQRGSPPMTFWYTDGGSIQRIEMSSINVQ